MNFKTFITESIQLTPHEEPFKQKIIDTATHEHIGNLHTQLKPLYTPKETIMRIMHVVTPPETHSNSKYREAAFEDIKQAKRHAFVQYLMHCL